jgi:serine protease AprX
MDGLSTGFNYPDSLNKSNEPKIISLFMKKFYFLFLSSVFFSLVVSAQFTKYVIKFKDKTGTPFSISNPSQFLSAKSIERRAKQKIAVDETDLPIVSRYIDSVRLAGNVIILNQSKWLNQVCIQTTDVAALAKINNFPFVINTQPVMRISNQQLISKNKFTEEITKITSPQSPMGINDFYAYGNSFGQINIHEGEYLHNKGFRGQGMLMAIIDAGFYHYQTLPAFDSVRFNRKFTRHAMFFNYCRKYSRAISWKQPQGKIFIIPKRRCRFRIAD